MANAKQKRQVRRSAFHPTQPESPSLKLVADNTVKKDVVLKARSVGQRFYVKELLHGASPFVIASGPAGTGKTYLAVLYAIQQLREGTVKKVVITRPNVGAGDDLGYLPGDVDSKMAPWMNPILDAFHEFYSAHQVEQMIKNKVIEIAPLVYMRGRTLKGAIVIADEMQNATTEQMKMLLTRIGEGSRFVVTGDIEQHDRPGNGISGLADLMRRLPAANDDEERESAFAVFNFGVRDVVRHEAIAEVLAIYA